MQRMTDQDGTDVTSDVDQDRHLIGREMSMAHRLFRREFLLASEVVRRVDTGDTERAGTVATHLRLITSMLHHHHGVEDDLIWPLLHRRAPEALSAHVAAVQDQHGMVATALDRVDAALSAWTGAPSAAARDRLVTAVEMLTTATVEHMAYEERHVVPMMERHVSLAEWAKCAEGVGAEIDPNDMPVVFGATIYEADADLIELTIANLPADMRSGMQELATQAFRDHATLIHGTATPPLSTDLL
jgi:hemerythrin-like domain-containing protein